MESTYFIIAGVVLLFLALGFLFKKKKTRTDYSSIDLYSGKTYFEICQKLGSPFLSEKLLLGLKSTWLLNDQRLTLCFDEDLVFACILFFSKLPKAVKGLPLRGNRGSVR